MLLQQPLLNHEYDDTISFSITSWKYDAERILQTAHTGRQMIIEGYLRSYTPAGKDTGYVSVTVRSGIVEMFGVRKRRKKIRLIISLLRFKGSDSRRNQRRVTYLIYRS